MKGKTKTGTTCAVSNDFDASCHISAEFSVRKIIEGKECPLGVLVATPKCPRLFNTNIRLD